MYLRPEFMARCRLRYGGIALQWSDHAVLNRRPQWIVSSERNAGFTFAEGRLWRVRMGFDNLANGHIAFPLWPLAVLFAVPPFQWWRVRRRWQKSKGTCPACGYDLRGTPQSNPCPECGAVRETAEAKA
jgi:hypothetical protein